MEERLPLCEGLGGGRVLGWEEEFLLGGWMPPRVWRDSGVEASGPFSGSESSSKMVFRFAGGGREASDGAFLVMLRP